MDNMNANLTVTFFMNHNGVPVADLYLGNRRLLATTHPATIVAAIYAMGLTQLTVVTSKGRHTGELQFNQPGEDLWPLSAINLRMRLNPGLYQFRHLAPSDVYCPLLEAFDLFAHEAWHKPPPVADVHLRTAHHHLPADLIKRKLETAEPKGWKKALKNRNDFVYFPEC